MSLIGTIAGIWRYPVKSMRGEQIHTAALDDAGLVGDRRYALVSTAAPRGKPLLTGRERASMLRYTPSLTPTPHVLTPTGEQLPLPSAALTATLTRELAQADTTPNPRLDAKLTLEHSPRKPLTDVRPLSFIAAATLRHLTQELGAAFDPQRLRSNLILALADDQPFAEEALGGQILRLGERIDAPVIRVLERVPRCRMVTLDPRTAEPDDTLLRYLARLRGGRAAMYAAVVHPGSFAAGAPVFLHL